MGVLNFLGGLLGGGQQAPDAKGAPQQTASLPGGVLNIFSAVRNMNLANEQAANDQAQRQQEADRTKLLTRGDDRAQQTFDDARSMQVSQGALGAYSNMVDSIDSNPNIQEADRPAAYAQAIDRVIPAIQAAHPDASMEQIQGLRQHLIDHPSDAGDILSSLQSASTGGSSQPAMQAAFDRNGNPVFVNGRTGRPVARGFAPATAVLGGQRVAVSQGNLEQRTVANDPTHAGAVAEQTHVGAARGDIAAQDLPQSSVTQARNAQQQDVRNIQFNSALQNIDQAVSQVSDLSAGLGSITAGVPGSPAANLRDSLEAVTNSEAWQQIQTLKNSTANSQTGIGRILNSEITLMGNLIASARQTQSPPILRANLARVRSALTRIQADANTYYQAEASRGTASTAPAASTSTPTPAAAPTATPTPQTTTADPRARRSGETTDQYLARLHL